MPFNDELRKRLLVLKEEFESGLLPQTLYEDLCKKAIDEFGPNAYINASSRRTSQPAKLHIDNNSLNQIKRRNISEEESNDNRKYNKGLSERRSYSTEEKLYVISLHDTGKSLEEIASIVGIAKSNVDRWCSAKGRAKLMNPDSKLRPRAATRVSDVGIAFKNPEILEKQKSSNSKPPDAKNNLSSDSSSESDSKAVNEKEKVELTRSSRHMSEISVVNTLVELGKSRKSHEYIISEDNESIEKLSGRNRNCFDANSLKIPTSAFVQSSGNMLGAKSLHLSMNVSDAMMARAKPRPFVSEKKLTEDEHHVVEDVNNTLDMVRMSTNYRAIKPQLSNTKLIANQYKKINKRKRVDSEEILNRLRRGEDVSDEIDDDEEDDMILTLLGE